MAGRGGGLAGAGTLQPTNRASDAVIVAMKEAPAENAYTNQYADLIPVLEHIQEELSKTNVPEPVNRAKVNLLEYK